ncbi:putative Proteasome subunit beta type-2-A [Monocercomonoides exilis]|uniref:putative Proteasome subunit beta type-2-A n=1 Tax=Monocercomonoides exilis TaxID=2049356 RepID=UPI003559A00D|nr:putative Proteasome subunit beta type-2-A [Monocercomonoides exilis]|eukprot:MONOS_13447.1-p1 / transcript=MONOS_13447.1 / gene=MONOS_13447 / organism=Monocercomonoides_exilis_PA203 / gene_product=Proteasome subunit beta type-2-A / transcript_product=Proteasome subunit beta type-2-A / location=Mono_scaffold00830:9369-10139(-) / protein_length=234 / sequence_SO=supercontig / SO=protein_coding / is_pseudo=false
MQSIFGFAGKDYVMIAAESSSQSSILRIKDDLDRIYEADDRFAFACVGEPGDDDAYSDYIVRNIQLNKFRNGYSSTTHANASWMRYVLAENLRKSPYQCNCVVGGVDLPSAFQDITAEPQVLVSSPSASASSSSSASSSAPIAPVLEKDVTPHLYYLDYLGTLCEIPFCAHGYCGYLLYGLWDHMWKKDMSREDGMKMLKASIAQIKKRFVMQQNSWIVKIITKDGIEKVKLD